MYESLQNEKIKKDFYKVYTIQKKSDISVNLN